VKEPAGSVLSCTWRVTSTAVDGVQDGTLDLAVADASVRPADIISPTERDED